MTTPHGNGREAPWAAPFVVTFVAETGSTNADLLAAGSRLAHGTVLVADRQTAGRGRLDRSWESPPDDRGTGVAGPGSGERVGANLTMSILFHSPVERAHDLTVRVAVAAARACERVAGVRPEIKWPNDLLLDGAKLAGILAQGSSGVVVVGLGLNVTWAPEGAAHLPRGSRDELVRAVLAELAALPPDVRDEYRRRLGTIGREVRVELAGEVFTGRAVDIADDGSLIVETGHARRVVTAGDIVHLRAIAG